MTRSAGGLLAGRPATGKSNRPAAGPAAGRQVDALPQPRRRALRRSRRRGVVSRLGQGSCPASSRSRGAYTPLTRRRRRGATRAVAPEHRSVAGRSRRPHRSLRAHRLERAQASPRRRQPAPGPDHPRAPRSAERPRDGRRRLGSRPPPRHAPRLSTGGTTRRPMSWGPMVRSICARRSRPRRRRATSAATRASWTRSRSPAGSG